MFDRKVGIGFIEKGGLGTSKNMAESERMLKMLIIFLENKHLDP